MFPEIAEQRESITKVLTSLEYGGRKEERELIDKLLHKYGHQRLEKGYLVKKLIESPGFEVFFLDVLQEVKPFALMMKEVYGLLSAYNSTAERRASIFRISSKRAESAFDFDMSSFPRETLRLVTELKTLTGTIQYKFGAAKEKDGPFSWDVSETGKLWDAIAPRWDADFYDRGFHRLLSYAKTITPLGSVERQRIEELVAPIIDRLKAACSVLRWGEMEITERNLELASNSYINNVNETIKLLLFEPQDYDLDRESTLDYLKHRLVEDQGGGVRLSGPEQLWIWDKVKRYVLGLAVSVTLWQKGEPRADHDDWLSNRFGKSFVLITPHEFVLHFEPVAKAYLETLEKVMPVAHTRPTTKMAEVLVEFLHLPFWKDRWFLYEIWTLARGLNMASKHWPVSLKGLVSRDDGSIEWKLAGADAREPVATIGNNAEIEVWTQLKTFHPETGKGLEPDLRIIRATGEKPDIIIVENKDRRKPSKVEMTEILDRYVTGTEAKYVALINYDSFTGPTHELGSRYPDREVAVFSNFRPPEIPFGFKQQFLKILIDELGLPVQEKQEEQAVPDQMEEEKDEAVEDEEINLPTTELVVSLTWEKDPEDLDLHAWVIRNGKKYHIYHSDQKAKSKAVFAWLDRDVQAVPGRETMTILHNERDIIWLAVHAYSEGQIRDARPYVLVEGLHSHPFKLELTEKGEGTWWHLIKIENGVPTILNEVHGNPPVED